MSYQVVVTCDLIDASAEDYERVRRELAKIALYDTVDGKSGLIKLPRNTFQGEWSSTSAQRVADAVKNQVAEALERCTIKGPIFVSVGGEDWTWAARGA